ncbi:putative arsenite methyltransferase [Halalkalicoccus paucihalophilus]|uniref:Putative arsenite methyltransferase n=1 Tax=Halalkalicoccus paucihalophilus TaxID=1008153 RepID=A0A151AJA5_9EURY|nr:methyltransferase domain-containing protein [Halalkalicoccus paucihalophilus]KYH27487.1 putative arsenite methyltransferase [Halalkalicoccus paucihalophilus]
MSAADFYTRWADLYDPIARRIPGIAGLRKRTAEALKLELGDVVVEMGCGTGANLAYLREEVGPEGTVIGVDFSAGVLERAREHVEREGWGNVHLVCGDATQPPLQDADAVVATFVVGMFSDPERAVEGWCEFVGSGGGIALLNATQSRRAYGPLVNVPFRAFVYASTPGRHELDDPTALLDRRVETAHATVERRCERTVHTDSALGLVRLTAGRVL